MDMIEIKGGKTLKGHLSASGSKNAALSLLFSTLLAKGEHIFHNIPKVKDIETACLLLKHLNCQTKWTAPNSLSILVPSQIQSFKAPYDLMRTMRAGILCLGPLLARWGQAQVSLPGGCAIGARPVHWHIENLKKMGAEIKIHQGYINGKNHIPLTGTEIIFERPTVGGTQNLMMAGCLAQGRTRIHHPAKEPEVVDLALYLNKMGANIQGAGTSMIDIQGVSLLKPKTHQVISDRIETATLLIAVAITKGCIRIENCHPQHLHQVLLKLKECGVCIQYGEDWIELSCPKSLSAMSISTAPYPGFPTDVQAQFMALMTQAQGESVIEECIFENRFMHALELMRLNAKIKIHKQKAYVQGPSLLQGAEVIATDLRASSCLILAGLVANGITRVKRIYHLDRGYEKLDKKLADIGADIKRIKNSSEH